jgi:hypothetical protein
MADTATIASLATAGGTLVLALATFASTRTSNRAARIAERALELNLRPVLIPAHEWDKSERVTFGDDQIVQLRGGFASVATRDGNLYFAAQLRNVGGGLGVLSSWWMQSDPQPNLDTLPELTQFNAQVRHLYVAPGDVGYWQGAIRVADTDRGDREALCAAVTARQRLALFLRYGDQDGGHDTITRYTLMPDEDGYWIFGIGRHWSLDSIS